MEMVQGKVAVVTGAASGIGRALAARFATEGMKVVLADLEGDAVTSAVADLRGKGFSVEGCTADVADPASVDRLAAFAVERFDEVHVVCNNAGVGRFAPFWEYSLQDWQWIMGVNFWGVVNGIRSFLPHLRKRGNGHIVNTASMAALMVMRGNGAYTASKFGVLAVSDSLRLDLRQEGSAIGVTVVCPGMVATDIANAERHRRDGVAPQQDQVSLTFRQTLATQGMAPEGVAGMVLDAIVANRPYVFTHPEMVRPTLQKRAAFMEEDLP